VPVTKPHPQEFRDDVVRVPRNREPGVEHSQIAKGFGTRLHLFRLISVDSGLWTLSCTWGHLIWKLQRCGRLTSWP